MHEVIALLIDLINTNTTRRAKSEVTTVRVLGAFFYAARG